MGNLVDMPIRYTCIYMYAIILVKACESSGLSSGYGYSMPLHFSRLLMRRRKFCLTTVHREGGDDRVLEVTDRPLVG